MEFLLWYSDLRILTTVAWVAAEAQVQSLAKELPYAVGVPTKEREGKETEMEGGRERGREGGREEGREGERSKRQDKAVAKS